MTKLFLKNACLVLCFCFSCGNGEETYTVEIIDGIRHIHNISPAWGDEPKVELEFVQKIGDLDSEDDNYALFNPSGIVRDTAGNIYIVDSGNYRVQKFDRDGTYLLTIGRQGQGPGEFAYPVSIVFDSKGNLLILDLRNNRIQKYSVDGDNLGSIRINSRSAFFSVFSTGEIVIPTSAERTEKDLFSLFLILDSQGKIINEIGEPIGNTPSISRTQRFLDIDEQDNVFISFMNENRIEKYTKNGDKVFRTDRPLNYAVPEGLSMQIVTTPDGETFEMPYPTIVSQGIQVDSRGRIWDMTLREQFTLDGSDLAAPPKYSIDLNIFDKNGILLGLISVDRSFVLFKIVDDRLFMVDSFETMAIYEYKIVEK